MVLNPEILLHFNRRTYNFIPSISDIPMSLSCSLRSSSNRRLVNSELHLDTRFEIYGSTIGVRNLVCYVPLCQQFNAAIQEKSPPPTSLSSFSLVLSVPQILSPNRKKRIARGGAAPPDGDCHASPLSKLQDLLLTATIDLA